MRRLFWRAGFGATSAEARYWARRSRTQTVDWLLRGGSGPPRPAFPKPSLGGRALDPVNEYGQDVLWWLDKMIRTPLPLTEKMTLFWHDHFATLDQDRPLQLAQNRMLRRNALGSFRRLLTDVTKDPAMLLFLSLADSTKQQPNENYARELMELFTLGSGYTENDVREAARALTGFRSRRRGDGSVAVLYDARAHDARSKRLFGQRGNFDYRDVLDLCIGHRSHAPFLVSKLWDYFVGTPIEPTARRRLAGVYREHGHRIAPVVREILEHPATYRELDAPDLVKSGRLRRRRAARLRRGDHEPRLGGPARGHGPASLQPTVGRRLGLGNRVAVLQHDAHALRHRQRAAGGAPPRPRRRRAEGRHAVAGGRSRALRGRPPVDLRGDRRSAAEARDPPAGRRERG